MKRFKEGDKVTVQIPGVVTWSHKKTFNVTLPDVCENGLMCYDFLPNKKFTVKRRK